MIDRNNLEGSIQFIGEGEKVYTPDEGAAILAKRAPHEDLKPDPELPDDTRLWAALQAVSGGASKGNIYDVDEIIRVIDAGKKALAKGGILK